MFNWAIADNFIIICYQIGEKCILWHWNADEQAFWDHAFNVGAFCFKKKACTSRAFWRWNFKYGWVWSDAIHSKSKWSTFFRVLCAYACMCFVTILTNLELHCTWPKHSFHNLLNIWSAVNTSFWKIQLSFKWKFNLILPSTGNTEWQSHTNITYLWNAFQKCVLNKQYLDLKISICVIWMKMRINFSTYKYIVFIDRWKCVCVCAWGTHGQFYAPNGTLKSQCT